MSDRVLSPIHFVSEEKINKHWPYTYNFTSLLRKREKNPEETHTICYFIPVSSSYDWGGGGGGEVHLQCIT